MALPYTTTPLNEPRLGLIALQSDETIERDLRILLGETANLMVSRVPSAPEVSQDTLAQMRRHLPQAAHLLPNADPFDVVAYGCTSGTAVIGPETVALLVTEATPTRAVTNPLSALIAACGALGVQRLALLSPYVEEVSSHLQGRLAEAGIHTPVFGSFDEPNEAKVVRITPSSLQNAGRHIGAQPGTDAVFLSCTNLRTLHVIAPLEDALGKPVLSSNLVLAWHMAQLSRLPLRHPSRLARVTAPLP